MKKNLKKLGLIFTISASLVMTTGCGKKESKKIVEDMVDRYSAYCTLGEYKGLEYEEVKTEITDDDVQYQVDNLIASYSTSSEVTEGKVENGDTVNIDFTGYVDGEQFDGGSTDGAGYELTLGSGYMIDGFEEQIAGHNIGETFDINVTFPDDYHAELAGKDAVFTITINSKLEKVMPEYNDEFVAANTDYKTVTEYEEYLKNSMMENAAASDENTNKSSVMNAAIEKATVNEYPQKEMQELIDDTVQKIEEGAASSGYDLESYVTGYYGMSSVDEFKSYVGDVVKSFMTEKIVVCAIAKAEGITVTDEEIKAYKEKMMEQLGLTNEEDFSSVYSQEDVAYYTLSENVVSFLLENAVAVESTETEETTTEEVATEAATATEATKTDATNSDAE